MAKMVCVQHYQYDLPDDSAGKEFVQLLADEFDKLSSGVERSEHVIVPCVWS